MNLSLPFVRRPIGTALLTAGIAIAEVRVARTRASRRSLSDTSPPRAARMAPNQIQGTSGL